jgi:hypothetical protein
MENTELPNNQFPDLLHDEVAMAEYHRKLDARMAEQRQKFPQFQQPITAGGQSYKTPEEHNTTNLFMIVCVMPDEAAQRAFHNNVDSFFPENHFWLADGVECVSGRYLPQTIYAELMTSVQELNPKLFSVIPVDLRHPAPTYVSEGLAAWAVRKTGA